MTEIERALLNSIQNEFPLVERPFQMIAANAGIPEYQCIDILKKLSLSGILRSIRAVLSWNRIGYSTVLIAVKIKPDCIDHVAHEVCKIDEVTHNYCREGHFNLWFTLIYKSVTHKKSIIMQLSAIDGVVDIRELHAEKTYKIGLILDV
jgi:DNA-binding Lrp family transcriptional regulator